jgi:hypothetical protein
MPRTSQVIRRRHATSELPERYRPRVDEINRNQRTICVGIRGLFPSESVDELRRITQRSSAKVSTLFGRNHFDVESQL